MPDLPINRAWTPVQRHNIRRGGRLLAAALLGALFIVGASSVGLVPRSVSALPEPNGPPTTSPINSFIPYSFEVSDGGLQPQF